MTTPFLRIIAPTLLASAALAVVSGASAQDKPPATDLAAQKVAASICSACHGPTGVSTSPLFPRLAGQQELYLAAQLKAFKTKTRGEADAHDYMWGMATLLDDSIIAGLARYYAVQKPGPGIPGNAALIARGKVLYEKGDPAHNVVGCATCHGDAAQGNSIFPRLAGQHAAYVSRQLEVIQHKFRESPVMHGVIKDLDAGAMKAVAEYVQSI
ncbi:MAG: c-type cytochrome [Caldimonas sp.]